MTFVHLHENAWLGGQLACRNHATFNWVIYELLYWESNLKTRLTFSSWSWEETMPSRRKMPYSSKNWSYLAGSLLALSWRKRMNREVITVCSFLDEKRKYQPRGWEVWMSHRVIGLCKFSRKREKYSHSEEESSKMKCEMIPVCSLLDEW